MSWTEYNGWRYAYNRTWGIWVVDCDTCWKTRTSESACRAYIDSQRRIIAQDLALAEAIGRASDEGRHLGCENRGVYAPSNRHYQLSTI